MSDDTLTDTLTLAEVVDQWFDNVQVRVDLAPSTIQTYVMWGRVERGKR